MEMQEVPDGGRMSCTPKQLIFIVPEFAQQSANLRCLRSPRSAVPASTRTDTCVPD